MTKPMPHTAAPTMTQDDLVTLLIFMVKMERTDVAQEEADAIASLLQSNGYDARSVMTDVVQRLEEMDMADEKVGE